MAKKTNGKRRGRARAKVFSGSAQITASPDAAEKLDPSPEPKPRRVRSQTAASTPPPKLQRRAKRKERVSVGEAVRERGQMAASTQEPKSQPRPKRRKRVSIGEALRQHDRDEHKFAEMFAAAGSRLIKAAGKSRGENKAFLDYLKEWSRYLEPPRTVEREGSDRAVPFMLVHHMPRPVREPAAENGNASALPQE